MARRFLHYELNDSENFPTVKAFRIWICKGIFQDSRSDYHYCQTAEDTDFIWLSHHGIIYGGFCVAPKVQSIPKELPNYEFARSFYVICESFLLDTPVPIANTSIDEAWLSNLAAAGGSAYGAAPSLWGR
jgi:hypothetical protein